MKLLPLTNDYVFKRNFGYKGEEEITRVLLRDILRSEVENVELNNNPITQKDIYDEKLGIMDVKATINKNTLCDIEMQVIKQADIVKRILFYWSKMYSEELKSGDPYEKAKKTVCILFADFEIKELEEIKKYITRWNLREEDYTKMILTDAMDIYIIELPKLERYGKLSRYTNLKLWVEFIKNPEVKSMIDEENENEELKDTVEAIEKARKNLEAITEDEHERELARLRDKYIRDQKSILHTGYQDGMNDGLEQGIKKGKEDGIEQGKKEEKIEIAKKMLSKGIDIPTISDITGLSIEEIESLSK